MGKTMGLAGLLSVLTLLTGCQQLNTKLSKVNDDLSEIRGVKPVSVSSASKKHIKNAWHVSDGQALAWLKHNQLTWDDNGKFKGVNWYHFWKQQLQAGTILSKKAYRACHAGATRGANCQTYWQAYSMVKSEKSRYWGKKMGNDA